MKPTIETLGERIRRIRGETYQADFGTRLGVSQGTVSAWERDDKRRLPSADIYFRLAGLAPKPEDQVFFLQEAGLSLDTIISAANQIVSQRIMSPAPGEIVLDPCAAFKADREAREPLPSIAYPAGLLSNPLLTRYFIIDEHSQSHGFDVDDILLLDVSDEWRAGPDAVLGANCAGRAYRLPSFPL